MVHYIGNIYNFNVPPEKVEINVDIPFFQQNPIKDEVLIQLDEMMLTINNLISTLRLKLFLTKKKRLLEGMV